MKRTIVTALLALLASAAGSFANEEGNAQKGHEFVRTMCTPCHSVEKGEPARAAHTAPSFQAVADTPGMTAIALTAWFRTPHHSMPNFVIATKDVRDISAYILGLKETAK